MPNVIDGINKMQAEQLSSQLATLKVVTMSNAFSEMGQKVSNKTVKLFNGIRKVMKTEPVKEPEVIPLDKRIADCKAQLDTKSREDLIDETRKVLIEKMKSLMIAKSSNPSDDELSIYVIEAAAKNFKKEINANLSPSQKADAVYQRYNERLIAQTQKKYNKASDEEKKRIHKQLQEDVDAMSEEQKIELKKALHVNEVTGETLSKFITTSAGASALLIALNVSGFGAFMALTTIMHAVFTTTLGITLPFIAYTTSTSILSFLLGPAGWIIFAGIEVLLLNSNKNKMIYELMSQVVWASVLELGGRITPTDESLPSWLPEEQRKAALSDNKIFMDLQSNYDLLLEKFNSQNEEIEKKDNLQKEREQEIVSLKNKISRQEEQVTTAQKLKSVLESELTKAQRDFEQYKQYADSENETLRQQYSEAQKMYKQTVQKVKDKQKEIEKLQMSNKDSADMINLYEEELNRVGIEKANLQNENEQMKEKLEQTKDKLNAAELKEAKKLQDRWEAAYKRFRFDSGVIKYVVKNYQYNEYGHIERRLMELHEAKDPAALSSNRGKMVVSGKLHLEVSTPTGFPSRIFYIPLKNDSSGKTVEITDICKHNDPRYGKK